MPDIFDNYISVQKKKTSKLYSLNIFLRLLIAICSFVSVLPDSSFLTIVNESIKDIYPLITTSCGIFATLLFITIKSLNLGVKLKSSQQKIVYLLENKEKAINMDNFELERLEIKIEKYLELEKFNEINDLLDDKSFLDNVKKI